MRTCSRSVACRKGDPGKSKSSVLRKLSHPNDNQLREWVREGAEMIAEHLVVPSLATVIAQVL